MKVRWWVGGMSSPLCGEWAVGYVVGEWPIRLSVSPSPIPLILDFWGLGLGIFGVLDSLGNWFGTWTWAWQYTLNSVSFEGVQKGIDDVYINVKIESTYWGYHNWLTLRKIYIFLEPHHLCSQRKEETVLSKYTWINCKKQFLIQPSLKIVFVCQVSWRKQHFISTGFLK